MVSPELLGIIGELFPGLEIHWPHQDPAAVTAGTGIPVDCLFTERAKFCSGGADADH